MPFQKRRIWLEFAVFDVFKKCLNGV